MFGWSSSCILRSGSTRLSQFSYVSFVSIERSVWMIALTGIVVFCVAVVKVTFIVGGVFHLDPSVESVNTIFRKVTGFRFMFFLASLMASGFCFASDCFLFGGLLCQRGSDRLFSLSDSPCHWFLFVCSPVELRFYFCFLGVNPPVSSFIFCFLIFSDRLSLS